MRFASLLSGGFITAPFAFCVIAFKPIEVQTRLARQNDRLNFRFEKYILQKCKNWLNIVENRVLTFIYSNKYTGK